jgi:hypothetical protein
VNLALSPSDQGTRIGVSTNEFYLSSIRSRGGKGYHPSRKLAIIHKIDRKNQNIFREVLGELSDGTEVRRVEISTVDRITSTPHPHTDDPSCSRTEG